MAAWRPLLVSVAVIAFCTLFAAISSPAYGTFPGKNGVIAYQALYYLDQGWDIETGVPEWHLHSPAHEIEPAWSPDGTKLVYARGVGGVYNLFVMYPGSGVGHSLTNYTTEMDVHTPTWSPDGTAIAWSSGVRAGPEDIYARNVDGTNWRCLTPDGADDAYPSWSPDGSKIAFASDRDGDWDIYVMDADGSNPVKLTENDAMDEMPDWSPDGTMIAFVSDRDGLDDIYTMGTDGTNVSRVVPEMPQTDRNLMPRWSPDQSQIAFMHTEIRSAGWYNDDIWTINLATGWMNQITNASNISEVWPSWQPLPVSDHKPIASRDSYTVPANQTLAVSAPGVLSNDEDLDGEALTARLSYPSTTSNGTLTFHADGSFTYTPNPDWTGTDVFQYLALDPDVELDPSLYAAAKVTITVTAPDTLPPTITIPDDGIVSEATDMNGAVVTFDYSANDDSDPNPSVIASPDSGSTFPVGTTQVTVTATDAAGNSSSATFSVTVRDTTPPELTVPADITTEATSASGAAVTFDVAASDAVGPVTLDVDQPSPKTFPTGTTTVHCLATDAHGNKTHGSFTVTVRDTTPPEITPPSDVTVEGNTLGGAGLDALGGSAFDLVDGAVTPIYSVDGAPIDESHVFPAGTTTVTMEATDKAHNAATPQTFTVTVTDATPPAFAAAPKDIVLEATGPSGASATWTAPPAVDIVDGPVTVISSPASGSVFAIGTTTVTVTATDAGGNTASASFTVTVRDTTPPHTTSNLTKAWYTGDVPVVLTTTDSGSGVMTIAYKLASARNWTTKAPDANGQVSFTLAASGSGRLLYYATDAAGNVETQQSVIFGIDRFAPVTCVDYCGGWSSKDVTLHFCAGDCGGSGLERTEYSTDGGKSWIAGATYSVSAEGQTQVQYRSSDKAGNVEAAHTVTVRIDKTAPVVTLATPLDGAVYEINQVVKASWSASDALSGLGYVSATTPSGIQVATSKVSKLDKTGKPVGYVYTVTASDRAGNVTTVKATYYVSYKLPAAFLAPIEANGSSLFKLGSSVTVAFQLTDANGANVSSAAATIAVTKLSATPSGTLQKPVVTTRPTTGTAFVYNYQTKQYVYYLGSSSLGAGDFRVTATLDDGGQITGRFSVK
jgi:dipeptidyl aminopeptidase/acylaminoacyl peptidase